MADFQGSMPVKTVRDDEFKIKLVDFSGTGTASTGLKIETDGSVNTNSKITDGTNHLAISAGGALTVIATDLDIRNLNATDDHVTVSATALDIRHLASGTDSVAVTGSVAVNEGTPVKRYLKSSSPVAANGTYSVDYVTTSAKTFVGKFVTVGARGACRIDVGFWDGVSSFIPELTVFQEPAMNFPLPIPSITQVGDGTVGIRVTVTNLDADASDLYTSIQGAEF